VQWWVGRIVGYMQEEGVVRGANLFLGQLRQFESIVEAGLEERKLSGRCFLSFNRQARQYSRRACRMW
jgi:hypothetical protein